MWANVCAHTYTHKKSCPLYSSKLALSESKSKTVGMRCQAKFKGPNVIAGFSAGPGPESVIRFQVRRQGMLSLG